MVWFCKENSGRCAKNILNDEVVVQGISTKQFGARAPRPLWSVLDCSKFEHVFNYKIQPWEVSLQRLLTNGKARVYKNLLVTGGCGFIGSNFINHILSDKYDGRVVNLDKLTYAAHDGFSHSSARYSFVRGDIKDNETVEAILKDFEIDGIVNFAAESHVDRSITGSEIFLDSNIVGVHTLLSVAKKIWLDELKWGQEECRFHQISTDEVYGSLGMEDDSFTELHPYKPNSPYSASKASADHLVRAWSETYGLPVSITNCSNNYGPYQDFEKLIPKVIHSCAQKSNIPVYGTGSNIRDWLHVSDHCRAIETVLVNASPGSVYNIGGNTEMTNLEICHRICDLLTTYRENLEAPES